MLLSVVSSYSILLIIPDYLGGSVWFALRASLNKLLMAVCAFLIKDTVLISVESLNIALLYALLLFYSVQVKLLRT